MKHPCNKSKPDTNRLVLIHDEPTFGSVWHPARWIDDHWEAVGFEDCMDDLECDPLYWMEMDFSLDAANKVEDGMPENDRYILIMAEKFFGESVWHPAAWLGEDDGQPGGEFTWAMNGLGYRKEEVNATHWMEMPTTE